MERAGLAAAAVAALLLFGAAPLCAQGYRVDIGVDGGGQYYTPLLTSGQLGTGAANASLSPGWRLGAQGVVWPWDRLGIRAAVGYAAGKIEQSGRQLAGNINLWDGMGGVLFRLTPVPAQWQGPQWLPYVTAGAGIKVVGSAATTATTNGNPGLVLVPTTTNGTSPYFLQNRTQVQFQAGLGFDLRLARHLSVRLEAGDLFWDPPVFLARGAPGSYTLLPSASRTVGDRIHEPYGTLGLQLLLGVTGAQRAVVVAPPPPPPPSAPAPAPAPAERHVKVCVLDPSAPQGTQTITATFRPATGDTVVDGQPFEQAVPTVMLAPQADWFAAGRPMSVHVGRRQWQYVTFGAPRVVDAGELAVLGTIGGLAVYAARVDVSSFWPQWHSALSGASSPDLPTLLKAHPELAGDFTGLQVLYVPLRAAGCVVQGLQQLQQVQKGSGG